MLQGESNSISLRLNDALGKEMLSIKFIWRKIIQEVQLFISLMAIFQLFRHEDLIKMLQENLLLI
jgi:hypothetical protein